MSFGGIDMDLFSSTERRLLRYAAVTTQSKRYEGKWPTTDCQRDLAKILYEELKGLGVKAGYDEVIK